MGYQVILARHGAGALSSVFQVLGKLRQMELAMSIDKPVVYFNREYLYWDPAGWNGSKNGWEYCFEPLSDIQLSTHLSISDERLQGMEAREMKYITLGKPEFTFDDDPHKEAGFMGLIDADASRLWQKWIKLNAAMKIKLARISEQLFPSRHILGVQATVSPAKSWEIETLLKRKAIAFPSYFTKIDDYLWKNPEAWVFLVTDSQEMAEQATQRYGTKLILFPRARCVNFTVDHLDPTPKLMEESVIDAYLLSRCNHLIHGISNVSAAAVAINPSIQHTDIYKL